MILAELQSWMHEVLVHPERLADEAAVDDHLLASQRLSARQRLAVYQRSYYARLLECMVEQFPALHHALGDTLFRDFSVQYLRQEPPQSHTLYDLGRRFPGYLEATRPDRELPASQREDWIDFMVDLARYEYGVFQMFDAAGHEDEGLATAQTPDHQLVLQRCFALGAYRYPVAHYYHAVREGADPDFPRATTSYVALARRDYQTHTYPLSEPHFQFLKDIMKSGDVTSALAQMARRNRRPPGEVKRSWLKQVRNSWINAGFFAARS